MWEYIVGVAVGLIVGIICAVGILKSNYYKDGQIDCINGAIYYKLDKQLDGSTWWVYSEEIVK